MILIKNAAKISYVTNFVCNQERIHQTKEWKIVTFEAKQLMVEER